MSFLKSKGFKYIKNFIIGIGASVVLLGALFKIQSWPHASEMLTVGLVTEAVLFAMLGILGPEPDYYWDKLYPGLSDYNSSEVQALAGGGGSSVTPLNGEVVENQLGGMLSELQSMSKSLGSLKALQEVDFSNTGKDMKKMGDFYSKMNEAMANLSDSLEDSKHYKDQLTALNQNLGSLNSVYGNILGAMGNIGKK